MVVNCVVVSTRPVSRWSYWRWRSDPPGRSSASGWGPCEADLSLSKCAEIRSSRGRVDEQLEQCGYRHHASKH
eukprot:766378-Pyramimonas_sp.AAC.1